MVNNIIFHFRNEPIVPDTPATKPLKSELQVLRLSDASKNDIMETLRFIHGQTFQLGQKSHYKDMGTHLKKGYWEERGNLVVQSVTDFSNIEKSGCESMDRFKMLSILKLESYGFDKTHCLEALDHCKGDSDDALELLYKRYFSVRLHTDEIRPDISENEIKEMRSDELAALQSIYDNDVIEEKEAEKVWLLKFKIDHLLIYSESAQKKRAQIEKENRKKQAYGTGVSKAIAKCRNFVATGKCKYGTRCKFAHDIQPERGFIDPNLDTNWFYLEFRFPKDCLYPYEAPIISLKTVCPDIEKNVCLRITRRCLEEAKILATDGMPSVYIVADLLQNEEEITSFLKNDRYVFPDPKKSIFFEPDEELNHKNGVMEKQPTHYTKGSTGRGERSNLNSEQMLKDDLNYSRKYLDRQSGLNQKNMMKCRQNLPAWSMTNDILNALERSQVVVISGETGCGKSTQVPQFILDNYLMRLVEFQKSNKTGDISALKHVNIICTQPRRLSAIGVAERVSDERCEKIGSSVGYQIRLENKISNATRLTFCTTGILLRRLQSDPLLNQVTHVVIDEVHERSEESDFLLLILKELLAKRKDLRVILMSATLNASLFSNYFNNAPVLEIPGRTFPVEQIFLEDILERTGFVLEPDSMYCRRLNKGEQQQLANELEYSDVLAANAAPPKSLRDENLSITDIYGRYRDYPRSVCKTLFLMDPLKINPELIEAVMRYIIDVNESGWPNEGSILIFLPGLAEIQAVHDALSESSEFSPRTGKYLLVPLHSTLTNEEQALVFKKAPPGKRKIVMSTNIAETSVTIDDCVFVIDCGQMKEKRFDANRNMESLELVWVSRANAMQRKGRAGRVMPGICIHLYTSHRFSHHFIAQPVPEIQRVPLEQLLLSIKTLPNFANRGIHEVISEFVINFNQSFISNANLASIFSDNIMEPPSEESILSAIKRLEDVGAFDNERNLTALGYVLATLPVDVRIGKLMVFGAIFQVFLIIAISKISK